MTRRRAPNGRKRFRRDDENGKPAESIGFSDSDSESESGFGCENPMLVSVSDDTAGSHEYHSLSGPCPFDHHHYTEHGPRRIPREEQGGPEEWPHCTCVCDRCPRTQDDERAMRRHAGPLRRHFPPPSTSDFPAPFDPNGESDGSYGPPAQLYELRDRMRLLPLELQDLIREFVSEFEPRKDKDTRCFPGDRRGHNKMTALLGQRPCAEMTPWGVRRAEWTTPCPNDRRGWSVYERRIWLCTDCKAPGKWPGSAPGVGPPGDPHYLRGNRWVCEDHIEDSKQFWEEEHLYEAHLVGTCAGCRDEFQMMYPNGRNTCTCRNWLSPWLCIECYEWRIRFLQNQFRRRGTYFKIPTSIFMSLPALWIFILANFGQRLVTKSLLKNGILTPNPSTVGPSFRGRIDARAEDYHRDWRGMRNYLVERHPCGRNHPANRDPNRVDIFTHRRKYYPIGAKRLLNNELVMDCRACGGIVVQPMARQTRAQRRRQGNPLLQLVGTRGGRAEALVSTTQRPTITVSGPGNQNPLPTPASEVESYYDTSTSCSQSATSYREGPPDAAGNPTTSQTVRPTPTAGPRTGGENPWDIDVGPVGILPLPMACVQDRDTARRFERATHDIEVWRREVNEWIRKTRG